MLAAQQLLEVPLAHRGVHSAAAPENSAAAFTAACDAGVGIELDVHPLSDGAVAVFHDLTLERMCGVPGELAAEDRASLRRLRLAGTDQQVPVLEEVLELVAGRVPLAIELKLPATKAAAELVCERVGALLATYDGPVGILSFDPGMLRWFVEHAPALARVQLGASPRLPDVAEVMRAFGIPRWQQLALASLVGSLRSRPHLVGYDLRALPHPAVTVARKLGRPVLTGIVRSAEELQAAAREGDGMVFEGLDPLEVRRAWAARAGS